MDLFMIKVVIYFHEKPEPIQYNTYLALISANRQTSKAKRFQEPLLQFLKFLQFLQLSSLFTK